MSARLKPVRLTSRQQKWKDKYGPWGVVTGSTDGIGREVAIQLAKAGLNLVLVARRQSVLESLAADLEQKFGAQTEIVVADLSDPGAVDHVLQTTKDKDVGLFVACAGFGTSGNFLDVPMEQELNMLDVNCRAVLAMTHVFGRRFAAQKRGGIILMSSLLAFQGVPRAANYAATKAYIQTLAEGLRVELAPHGVDVLASAPGPILTGFAARADMNMAFGLKPKGVAKQTLGALGRKTTVRPGWLSKLLEGSLAPLPRWGRVSMMRRVMGGMTKHKHGAEKAKTA